MDSNMKSALQQAVSSTFEHLAFLLPDDEVSEDQGAAVLEGSCRVRFRGPVSGALEIEVFGPVLPELAANMLGCDGPPPPELSLEALGELANVVCGNVLPAVSGMRAVFDLSAPETTTAPMLRRPLDDDTLAACLLGVGEGRVEVVLRQYA